MSVRIINGDCRSILPTLEAASFDCVVTSPPYFGLRDYGVDGQIGLEPTLEDYLDAMVGVCDELWRVLKPEGTFWLNLGDSYANDGKWGGHSGGKHVKALHDSPIGRNKRYTGFKPKDLIGVPWRVAFALQARGWWLRSAIVWHKPNPMPESVTDRPTSAYEMVFLLTKSDRYFYDAGAIAEPVDVEYLKARWGGSLERTEGVAGDTISRSLPTGKARALGIGKDNARNVWTIATQPFKGSHFATMPPDLVERCIKAGCPPKGFVLDPFGGAGTTGLVADRLGRHATLIEINPAYREMGAERIRGDAGMFADVGSP